MDDRRGQKEPEQLPQTLRRQVGDLSPHHWASQPVPLPLHSPPCRLPAGFFWLAAVTNRHRLGGLKQQRFLLSQIGGQKSENTINTLGYNPAVSKPSPPQEGGSRGQFVPCLFQLLVAAGVPRLVAPTLQSLPLPSHGPVFSCVCACACAYVCVCVCLISPSLSYKDTCDGIWGPSGQSWIIPSS